MKKEIIQTALTAFSFAADLISIVDFLFRVLDKDERKAMFERIRRTWKYIVI